MIPGFEHLKVSTAEVDFSVLHAGEGDPVVLLHGFPQTSRAWWKIAPAIARTHHVIVPDLPGYGRSRLRSIEDFDFSKRNVGRAIIALIREMGIKRKITLVGHDRGARVAFRMAMDAPEALSCVSVIGSIPTLDVSDSTTFSGAHRTYHWFLLTQEYPVPETLIGNNVDFFIRHTLQQWSGNFEAIGEESLALYVDAFRDPAVLHSACEDYRASFADIEDERVDRANGKRVTVPFLLINNATDKTRRDGREQIWSRWVNALTRSDVESGHFAMEEKPDETIDALMGFLAVHE